MAGVHRQHMGLWVERHSKGALEVGAQGFDLWRESGLGLTFGPHQLVAKFGELGRLAFFPNDQLVAQHHFPALEFAPHMAVRQVQMLRCARNRAVLRHGLQQVHQRMAQQRPICHRRFVGAVGQAVVEINAMHKNSYVRK